MKSSRCVQSIVIRTKRNNLLPNILKGFYTFVDFFETSVYVSWKKEEDMTKIKKFQFVKFEVKIIFYFINADSQIKIAPLPSYHWEHYINVKESNSPP